MQVCTIIYDGDPLESLPYRELTPERRQAFNTACFTYIREAIEDIAKKHALPANALVWNPRIGINPVFARVACEDALADAMRLELPDDLLIEFNAAECDQVWQRICNLS